MPERFNLKVLVVDDSLTIRAYLQDLIKERGCEVQTADNGEAALDILHRFQADLVILDFHMPQMDGFTMLRSLQSEPDLSGVSILVLTGKALDDGTFREVSQEPNVKAVLTKPTDDRTILHLLREFSKSKGKFEEPKIPAPEQGAPAPEPPGGFEPNFPTFELKDLEKPPRKPDEPKK